MRIRSVWFTKWSARVMVTLLRLLFASCRKQRVVFPGTNAYDPDLPERFLYCVWHDVLVFPLFVDKPHHMSALTSQHQDGSYLAESLKLLRVSAFRGSTSRGGARAVRQLLDAADRLHITITPDGPRGPRRQMKDGIVFLASRTGRAIVPMAFGCRRGFRIRGSWTDMLIPWPFTTLFVMTSEPIRLSESMSREELDDATKRVQAAMDDLYARLDECTRGSPQPIVESTSSDAPRQAA